MTILLFLLVAAGGSELTYDRTARVSYINEGLLAVRGTDLETLHTMLDTVRSLERSACRSEIPRLRIECLMSATRRRCKGAGELCPAWSDVIVTTVLSERQLFTAEQRHAIMRRHNDYRSALAQEVARAQASLALAFHLASQEACDAADQDCLAEQIDRYCMAAADEQNLAWQHCAATLVWFIATGREL